MLKLWVGGIIDADIADSFRELRNTLQQAVNAALHNQHYGDALGTWDVVIAVCSRPPSEHVRYSARTKETDIRVVIDHALFEQSSLPERANLLAGAVLDSLHRLRVKAIAGVDFDRLQHDVSVALAQV